MKKLGLLLIVLVLMSCAPQPTPTPISTPTSTPTATSTPTPTPTPTVILTSVEAEWLQRLKQAPRVDAYDILEKAPTDRARDVGLEWLIHNTPPKPTPFPGTPSGPRPTKPAASISTPTPKIYVTHTKVFAGQTPGEALVEWKEAFPERTVVEWKIGLNGDGNPVELEISYTK